MQYNRLTIPKMFYVIWLDGTYTIHEEYILASNSMAVLGCILRQHTNASVLSISIHNSR